MNGVITANRVAIVCTTHGKTLLKARFCGVRPTRLPANTTSTNADLQRDYIIGMQQTACTPYLVCNTSGKFE